MEPARAIGDLDGQSVGPASSLLWRSLTADQRGKRADRVSTAAFRSSGGTCISLCVRDPAWGNDYTVDWLEAICPGHGVAEISVEQILDAGFSRVIWAELEEGKILPGHVNAFYPERGRNRAIERARGVAEIIREPRDDDN